MRILIEIRDDAEKSECKARILTVGAPEDKAHYDVFVEAFEKMWPSLKKKAWREMQKQKE